MRVNNVMVVGRINLSTISNKERKVVFTKYKRFACVCTLTLELIARVDSFAQGRLASRRIVVVSVSSLSRYRRALPGTTCNVVGEHEKSIRYRWMTATRFLWLIQIMQRSLW